MKRNNIALFTVIYPAAERFIHDFNVCLANQTFKSFDLIVVNDGCRFSAVDLFQTVNVLEIKGSSSIAKNRELGINFALLQDYEVLILCDIDDVFTNDRVAKSIESLGKADIVVNDLDIIGPEKEILSSSYFSHSVTSDTVIDLNFILNKNILGFSNTALKLSGMKKVSFPAELKVVDWYFFTLLIQQDAFVKFIPESLTGYRQHGNNMIGIDDFSIELFKKMLHLKYMHFSFLSERNAFFLPYKNTASFECSASDEQIKQSLTINRCNRPFPLWWENIRIV